MIPRDRFRVIHAPAWRYASVSNGCQEGTLRDGVVPQKTLLSFTDVPKSQTLIPLKSQKTEVFETRPSPLLPMGVVEAPVCNFCRASGAVAVCPSRVSGSSETKTYGKSTTASEHEEEPTLPRKHFFGKDSDERLRVFNALHVLVPPADALFSGKLSYTVIARWCRASS